MPPKFYTVDVVQRGESHTEGVSSTGNQSSLVRSGVLKNPEQVELEEHHLKLLRAALEAWDRAQEARQVIATEGIVVDGGRYGKRAHPAIAIEKDARIAFARLMRELDLDAEPLPEPRPPRRS